MVALSLLLLASVALATPIPSFADLGARDETAQHAAWDGGFTPVVLLDLSLPVTYPTAGVVWKSGGAGYMTWDNTLPAGVTHSQVASTARLVLGYTSDSSVGLHLDLDHPLGINIQLYNSTPRFDFRLPAGLPTRSTYILSFQGSSGNLSPEFTIEGVDPSSSSTSSETSTTSSEAATGPVPTHTSHTSSFTSSITSDLAPEDASSTTSASPEAASTYAAGPAADTIVFSSGGGFVYSPAASATSTSGASTSTVLSTASASASASAANAAVQSSGSITLAASTLVAGLATLLAASILA